MNPSDGRPNRDDNLKKKRPKRTKDEAQKKNLPPNETHTRARAKTKNKQRKIPPKPTTNKEKQNKKQKRHVTRAAFSPRTDRRNE